MKQQIVVFVVVLLHGMTLAQFPCELNFPMVQGSKTHTCEMKKKGKCNKIMLVVTGFAKANGYGASISTSTTGKSSVTECHILTRKGQSTLNCREIYLDNSRKRTGEKYQVNLGTSSNIESVIIAVSRRMVKISANKHSSAAFPPKKNPKKEKIPYNVEAVFPIREASGFCSVNTVHYKANGVVFKTKDDKTKKGSGYTVSAYKASF